MRGTCVLPVVKVMTMRRAFVAPAGGGSERDELSVARSPLPASSSWKDGKKSWPKHPGVWARVKVAASRVTSAAGAISASEPTMVSLSALER